MSYKVRKNRIQNKLDLLEIKIDYKTFFWFRIITTITFFLILLFISKAGFIIAPIVSVIYYVLFEIVLLDMELIKRNKELEQDALEFFPLFTISLKSTGNVKKSLINTTNIIDNRLSKEFKKVLRDVKAGKSLEESLYLLNERIPSKLINNMIISIMEANKSGNDISDSLDLELSYINDKLKKANIRRLKTIPFDLLLICFIFILLMLMVLIIFKLYL